MTDYLLKRTEKMIKIKITSVWKQFQENYEPKSCEWRVFYNEELIDLYCFHSITG
jgi:hypothetical protein